MATSESKNVNFIGLSAAYYADVQNPNRTDQPVNWTPLGNFSVDSTNFGRDDVTEFSVNIEESDDPIFNEYTHNPLKFSGNIPNLNDDAKVELGGYVREVLNGETTLKAPSSTPNVVRMIKLIPKSGKFNQGIILYNMTINLNIGDNLSKTATLNDKISMTALKPTEDLTWTDGSAYAYLTTSSIENNILEFTTIFAEDSNVIDDIAHEVNIGVPNGTDISAVIPFIRVSDGATIAPTSLASQAFTTAVPVVYTVTAEDGTTVQTWDVTITVAV